MSHVNAHTRPTPRRALIGAVVLLLGGGLVASPSAALGLANGRIAYVKGSVRSVTDVASLTGSGRRNKLLTRTRRNELYVDTSSTRMVAFTRFGRNGGDIYTVPVNGGAEARLTSDKVHDELPIWSPDGSRIAFLRYVGGGDAELFVMDADGSNKLRITDNTAAEVDPRWSPDGKRLIFGSGNQDEGGEDIYLTTVGTPGTTQLTESGVHDLFGDWAPDGESIVYASLRGEQWDLFSVTTDGLLTTQLTDHVQDDYQPKWAPDGSHLLFVRGKLEGIEPLDRVFTMDAGGTTALRVTPARLDAFSPTWSPDSQRIVFVGKVNRGLNWELFTVGSHAEDLTRLTRTGAMEFDPSWGPRG